ncbi:MAG: hypothetical protein KJ578_15030 [Bacteroidetes bacterium]|nr:hypothetical protein [Bacteroidota bacterium]MBU1579413.1 hypothetical protein [Bacteroidota bacterium]MBU2559091.1 hypothetical protein [Bacteroidota bacterium]
MWRYLLLLFLGVISCTNSADLSKGEVIAKVYGNYLYEADIKGIVGPEISKQDSLMLVNSFIDNWIRKQLLIRQAEKNLTAAQMNFKQNLEDYRNSLLIYNYESQLIKEKLDTIISESEIADYYENNKQNFELRHNLVKAIYAVLPLESEHKDDFRALMQNTDTLELNALDELAGNYAISYYNDTSSWIRFDDLLMQIPIETYNQELFLNNITFVEVDNERYTYMVYFSNFLNNEGVSPLEIEHDNIKNIILNQRKQSLLRETHQGLYDKALREKVIEIY